MQENAAQSWTRDTAWRQGQVLTRDAAEHLGLAESGDSETACVMVISHDCDLANANLAIEPEVEVIVGQVLDGPANGNYTWAKAPRTLHLTLPCGGRNVVIELTNTRKRAVAKEGLAGFSADPSITLSGKDLSVLRSWLASRYQRAAFPDAFVERMKSTKADAKLARLMDQAGDLISFVYMDLDEGRSLERLDGEPYVLSIVLVFNSGDDAESAAERADALAEKLDQAMRERFATGAAIVLRSCFSISEDDITIRAARTLTQWRLEHMTLRADEEQLGSPSL